MFRILCAFVIALAVPSLALSETVISSFYHEGHTTANGEHYYPDRISCAHRSLAFGTMVKVTNIQNGKSVVCRVNDRGPHIRTGATIDLSRGAFRQIADLDLGRIKVELEIVN